MNDTIDCAVIGAGVIGLAIGRAVALTGRSVVVLERHAHIGEETSSRNSEVVHAGIYYPPGSLKAQLCVDGRQQLYEYCDAKGIGAQRCGKIIVASDTSRLAELDALMARAAANGVTDLERLDRAAVERLEPELDVAGGVLSPSSGIVDSHALMLALQGDLEHAGGIVAPLSSFERADRVPGGLSVTVDSGGERSELTAAAVVNAAGLEASAVASRFPGECRPDPVPRTRYAKGNYFALSGATPFQRLVYPLPDAGGLGVHATLDFGGRVRFGPDVEWIDAPEYSVDAARAASFYASIRGYWPGLADGALVPDYAGVRPKLHGPGEPPADFGIARYGPGIHLFGIESPGLTACLAIGGHVATLLAGDGA